MSTQQILILPGDGIGPEVVPVAVAVLEAVAARHALSLSFESALVGGCAIDETGEPLPAETLTKARESRAVLLGAVGGPRWDDLPTASRPERGLLGLRSELELFANLRPALLFPPLAAASSLKSELVAGLDILIVRELTGGIYFGEPRGVEVVDNERRGFNTYVYSDTEYGDALTSLPGDCEEVSGEEATFYCEGMYYRAFYQGNKVVYVPESSLD